MTPKSFATWKEKFEKEMLELHGKKVDANEHKLTGRKFFETRVVKEEVESSDSEEEMPFEDQIM